jgi:2-iminobutanoate/2-iminopropanoate deaminase
MTRNVVATTAAPAAIGPYSQAIEIDGFLFCSGQLGIDPATGKLLDGVEEQTDRALLNLEGVLGAAGLSFGDVVKVNVFIADLANFAEMNAVYARHIVAPPPARSTVQVAALPLGAMVEIEAVARKSPVVDAVASPRTR